MINMACFLYIINLIVLGWTIYEGSCVRTALEKLIKLMSIRQKSDNISKSNIMKTMLYYKRTIFGVKNNGKKIIFNPLMLQNIPMFIGLDIIFYLVFLFIYPNITVFRSGASLCFTLGSKSFDY